MASGSIDLGSNAGAGITKAVSLTTAQRYALVPYDGTVVYDSSLRCLFIYNVDRWYPAQPIDPRSGFLMHEDWACNQLAGSNSWTGTGDSGSDAALYNNAATGAVGQTLQSQTTAGGYSTLFLGDSYTPGAQSLFLDVRSYPYALSTGSEEFELNIGFGNTATAAPFTNGIFFCYDRATDGNFWSCKTTAASATTKTVTAVAPVAATYQMLSFAYYGGSVKFYIAGTLVATHTTNLPTASIGARLKLVKSVGTNPNYLITDLFSTYSFFDTRR